MRHRLALEILHEGKKLVVKNRREKPTFEITEGFDHDTAMKVIGEHGQLVSDSKSLLKKSFTNGELKEWLPEVHLEFDCHYQGRHPTDTSHPAHPKIDMEIMSTELRYSKTKHTITLCMKAHEHKASMENRNDTGTEDGSGNEMHDMNDMNNTSETNKGEKHVENTNNMSPNENHMNNNVDLNKKNQPDMTTLDSSS